MAERQAVVDHMRLTYEGLFSVTELYKTIDRWLRDKGYDKCEQKNIEKVTPEGKYIEIQIEPWKKLSDYAKSVIKLRMIMDEVKEVEVERDNKKVKLNQGKIQMIFDAFLETDYEHRWEGSPLFYFFKVIIDKYISKPFTSGYQNNVLDDLNHFHSLIKSFLNLYRYSETAWTSKKQQKYKF